MQFKIQQFSIYVHPARRRRAMELLAAIGLSDWVEDTVDAHGTAGGQKIEHRAHLARNHQASSSPVELEVATYLSGMHWNFDRRIAASHLAMHVTERELEDWRALMKRFGVEVAQEVRTTQPSASNGADTHPHHCVVFYTRTIIGIDLKFIVRRVGGLEE